MSGAALELGRTYVERNYGEAEAAAEEAEKAEKARLTATRRSTETLYKVHPFEPSELIDEGYHAWFGKCRAIDLLSWAEARVLALGFNRHQEENVLTLTLVRDEHIVFADIRSAKKIRFNIFKNPPNKSKRLKKSHFDFPDNFAHDLKAKFEERLATALLLF
ncbi:hypothetical protein [Hyphomicrobium sp. 2TAF46]|uniref:hypothetical protein n=1 Tax=Hyphomicrobium sp. 2TAF46 TaxID=3233019 RepID=UPI003F921423